MSTFITTTWVKVLAALVIIVCAAEASLAVLVSTPTGDMIDARMSHTATLLPNGKVLVVGGYGKGSTPLASAELWDPVSGTFTATGSMTKPRTEHSATLLPNGKVLVVGGADLAHYPSTELYDPVGGNFAPAGPLYHSRFGHTATMMLTEFVLIVGGIDSGGPTTFAELYYPREERFIGAGNPLIGARTGHTATLLKRGPAGKVLIAGGICKGVPVNTAVLYDTASQAFTTTGNLLWVANAATATLLSDGNVLIAGGLDGSFQNISRAQLYETNAGTFASAGDMIAARGSGHTATLLPSNNVLIAGGRDAKGAFKSTELYDANTRTFRAATDMATPRCSHTATLLPNGKVLIAGGWSGNGTLSSRAEVYEEVINKPAVPGNIRGN